MPSRLFDFLETPLTEDYCLTNELDLKLDTTDPAAAKLAAAEDVVFSLSFAPPPRFEDCLVAAPSGF